MSIKLLQAKISLTTPIPNIFIEKYMPKAPPSYSMVYIYTYCLCSQESEDISNLRIAESLNMLESDVMRAWKYWDAENVVSYDDKTNQVEILDLTEKSKPEVSQNVIIEKRPHYTNEEISIYLNKSKDVKQLFSSAQSHLGKMLSYNDMSIIFSFYDWLRMPMEVIEILLAYCSQNNHRSLRYIEKVAIDWAESGIDTPQKAISRIKLYSNDYRQIMKVLGQGDRNPTPAEENYFKKWLSEYNMDMDIIVYACEKTILMKGQANFSYIDGILKNWSKQSLKTLHSVKQSEIDFVASKKAKISQNSQQVNQNRQAPVKKNRFVNYEQPERDFDEFERMEREFINRDLE